jgi:hypothetical protein
MRVDCVVPEEERKKKREGRKEVKRPFPQGN